MSVKSIGIEDIKLLIENNTVDGREYLRTVINGKQQQTLFDAIDRYLLLLANSNDQNINILMPRLLSYISLAIKYEKIDLNDSVSNKLKVDKNLTETMKTALKHLESLEYKSAIADIIESRQLNYANKSLVTYFYDTCISQLISNCVKTVLMNAVSDKQPNSSMRDKIAIGKWVESTAAARIDLQGGWTDTPPICYELGGKVLNIAININDCHPIGAKARKVPFSNNGLISIKEYGLDNKLLLDIKLNSIQDLSDYRSPDSGGALNKAALICADIVDIAKPEHSLYDQLESRFGSALEIELWSYLPQGSGLGTSSILAGCVLTVLWTLSGYSFTRMSLLHSILYLEQLLTTGGGWQDQVGGLIGGIKLGFCDQGLPLKVEYKSLVMKTQFKALIDEHLILIYTGTVRLAKNLLQNVIRSWYMRDKKIIDCFKELAVNAELCWNAIINEDIETVGSLLNRYWQQKKILAPDCEPTHVATFLSAVNPYIYGGSMCGAGGGGFMCVILKNVSHRDYVICEVKNLLPDSQVYKCNIDENGFQILIDGQRYDIP